MKFKNKNNALQRSNAYHQTMISKLDYDGHLGSVHKNYHRKVFVWQCDHKAIMPKKQRKKIYDELAERFGTR